MADLERLRAVAAEAAEQHRRAAAGAADLATTLGATRLERDSLRAAGDTDGLADAERRIGELLDAKRSLTTGAGAVIAELNESLVQLLGREVDLEGDVPLVLLPVRIETRSTADGSALRIRVFPDAVHTEGLDPGLTEAEVAAGRTYWTSVWASGQTEQPWPELQQAVGVRRAPWVAEALRPTNLTERPAGEPIFAEPPVSTGRHSMVRTLPDRFLFRVEQNGAAPEVRAGRAIPDALPVGLTEMAQLDTLSMAEEDLPPLDAELRWLVDYPAAVEVGLGLTVPLPLPGQNIRRVLVYGVRAGLDAAESAERLEGMLRSHRFTDGVEFLAQGTPTNNTDSVRPEWSRRTPLGPPTLLPAAALPERSNAAVTSTALGLDAELVATLPGAADQQQGRARAFATALWTTTWGDAIEHLTRAGRADAEKRLTSPKLDAVQDHWVDHVRGRGPLPAVRIGRQPYGLLPILQTDATYRPVTRDFAERGLVDLLRVNRFLWEDAVAAVPTVMSEPLDVAIPAILGTDAVLRGLRVRTAVTPEPVFWETATEFVDTEGDLAAQQQMSKALGLITGVTEDALDDQFLVGKKTRTLALPLVHESDGEFIANLLEPVPRPAAAQSVLQVLLAHADGISRDSIGRVATPELIDGPLRAAVQETSTDIDRDLVGQALEAVQAGALDDALVFEAERQISERVGVLDERLVAARQPLPALAPPTMLQQVAGLDPSVSVLVGSAGIKVVGALFRASRRRAAFVEALRVIGTIEEPAERRLLLAETLDCCSHRFDAWLTSIASRRLGDLRSRTPSGAYLGAYGVVEHLRRAPANPAGTVDGREVLADPTNGGFVHAPGLVHAATAGVLRSGRLSHRRGDAAEALDIDLSSTRVRDAVSLLDGVRRGQTLGALLGYRLERRLHERSGQGLDPVELDRFIYVLRTLAPLRLGKLTESGAPAQESLAANNVVDGLLLLERLEAGTLDLATALGTAPKDYALYVGDAWVPPTAAELAEVRAEIEALERTHDAVADLLLAESVHQLVSGNPARAASVLDVLGAGEAVPPDPEVVTMPRSGVPIAHRLAVVLPDPAPAALAGWATDAPRALAEPRLEVWAQGALGPATDLVVEGDLRFAGAGLSALDVIYDADGDAVQHSTLAVRLRTVFGDQLSEELANLQITWELAGMLRGLLAGARALDRADVGRPVDEHPPGQPDQPSVGRLPDAAEIGDRAAAAVAALRAAMAAGLPSPEVPEPDPRDALSGLLRFGLRQPPTSGPPSSEDEQRVAAVALLDDAERRATEAERLLAKASPAADPPSPTVRAELARQALAAVFGTGFLAVPVLLAPPPGEGDLWRDAVGPAGVRARPGADIRPWLQRAGTLRPEVSAYGATLLVRESLGRAPALRVVQTPAAAYGTWVGLPFPDARPPMTPLSSLVVELGGLAGGDAEPDLTGPVAGLVLDEWTEVIPRRLERRPGGDPDAEPELVDVTTTGLAVHANAPGARPPQAILLAMTPDGGHWTADRLVGVIDEALALARIRGVTLEQIPLVGRYLPALYFRDWSLQGEPVIDWARLVSSMTVENNLAYLKVEQ
ncbi:MAG TPA: hypothetical protein VEX66_17875 [Microlunatus sp.]|nr:hypothetical protein [Microlunatus sp.]